jgi:ectoine hydroxylase-related dioxygenase (phytanoyl-CoA dioxygenase family)
MADLPGQLTICLEAGDAVAIDYRLLHSTHGSYTDSARDCILLSFTPSWRELPDEVKGHLIQHPCQPSEPELAELSGSVRDVLPAYGGPRRSLLLNRNAPADFKVVE